MITHDRIAPTTMLSGAGSPEGRVAATVGTAYTDTHTTNGAIQWVKASGSGSTGWQVAYGDTGVRDITGTIPTEVISGKLLLARTTDTIWITFDELKLVDGADSWHLWNNFIPDGFYPKGAGFYYADLPARNQNYAAGPIRLSSGQLTIYGAFGEKLISGVVSFPAPPNWPTIRPGNPS